MAKGPYDASLGKLPPGEGQTHVEEVLRQNTVYREKMEAQIKELKAEINAMNAATVSRIRTQSAERSKQEAQILNLNTRLEQLENQNYCAKPLFELQTKLRETIRAVERLAKGKSLGALGLPTEESWQQSTS